MTSMDLQTLMTKEKKKGLKTTYASTVQTPS